ncbi:MAG: hypothetical protein IJX14_01140 [Clostridia bacterium]|nr:hypothetical protein [Clostridia bacterium]
MTIFWNGIGVVFCGLAAVMVLKETRKEFTPYILLTVGILSFLALLPILQDTSDLLAGFSADLPYAGILLKAAGLVMLTEMGVEICKSVGENNMAGYVALLGKTEIWIMALPLYSQLIEMVLGFLV